MFRKDPQAIKEWSEENVLHCSQRQERIVEESIAALQEGGYYIYSTCSYSFEEDEKIMDYIASLDGMLSVKIQLPFSSQIVTTYSPTHQAQGFRFYPDKIKGEGFFIAAFKKEKEAGIASPSFKTKEAVLEKLSKKVQEQLQNQLALDTNTATFLQSGMIKAIPAHFEASILQLASQLYIKKAGVSVGEFKGQDFIPAHELAVSYLPLHTFNAIDLDKEQALSYLRRADFNCNGEKGWNLMRHNGLGLGWAKILPNRMNNYYPQEWRILKT